MPQCDGSCTGRVGPSLAPDTLWGGSPWGGQPRPGFLQWHRRQPCRPPPSPVSSGAPGTGPYLMELSDETSLSESSVSLGGGGGSLSGTAVKTGDFLEKNTRCHLGASRKKHQLSPWGRWGVAEASKLAFLWPCPLRHRGMPGEDWGGKKDSSGFNLRALLLS